MGLYDVILNVHDNKKHTKNLESDWNGVWQINTLQNDDNNNYLVFDEDENDKIIKIKRMSDFKLKGFIKSFEFCDIDGALKQNNKNKSKKFIIFYHDGMNKNKRMTASAKLKNKNTIKIEWESIAEHINEST